MNRRSSIDERCERGVLVEPEHVFDWRIGACRPPVGEDIRSDLGQRDLEVHEVAIVLAAPDRLTQPLNGFMKRLQSLIEVAEGGMELKGLRMTAQRQKPVRASSTVAK